MARIVGLLSLIGITASAVIAASPPSRADDGQIAAGVIGGLALGTLFGAAASQPRYYTPEPVYVVPPPVVIGPAADLFGTSIAGYGYVREFECAIKPQNPPLKHNRIISSTNTATASRSQHCGVTAQP